jgi:uncharacterized OB-fold protein
MTQTSAMPILPDVGDPVTAPFWAGAREGRLLVQTCDDCGAARFPPRPFCAACGSQAASWRESSGRGRIWSWVLVHGPTLPAFAEVTPFPVAVVELDDPPGVRLVGNLVADPGAGINSVARDQIAIGLPVAVCFRTIDQNVALPAWRLIGE